MLRIDLLLTKIDLWRGLGTDKEKRTNRCGLKSQWYMSDLEISQLESGASPTGGGGSGGS